MLTAEEIAWLNTYHARVLETIASLVDVQARAWLLGATTPLPRR
jgi:Xaa-Pro aminopeptidase